MNSALKFPSEWLDAVSIIENAGLTPYHDPQQKTWDALRACNYILEHGGRQFHTIVLDVGGLRDYSYISQYMAAHRYLIQVINPEFPAEPDASEDGRIIYHKADATKTHYFEGTFDAITCLSVIEHGVDLQKFFAEASRILKPGGLLIISTDYWIEPIHTGERTAFGAPVKIFTPDEIRSALNLAMDCGLFPTGIIDYRVGQPQVFWMGLQYTFIDFALRKA